MKVRAVIDFFCLLDTPDEDILARLWVTYGEGIVNPKTMSEILTGFSIEMIETILMIE
jgi:hypothetical protein